MNSAAFPNSRRHTLYFLDQSSQYRPVFLSTEVDATAMQVLREKAKAKPDAEVPGVVAMVMFATGRALSAHPMANGVVTGSGVPSFTAFPLCTASFRWIKRLTACGVWVRAWSAMQTPNRWHRSRPRWTCSSAHPLHNGRSFRS